MMQGKSFSNLGWVAAAFMAGLFLFAGFQPSQEKTGVVDMNKVISESKLGKKNQDDLQAAFLARQNLLAFLDNNRVATVEQATKLRGFALKGAPLTPQEKTEDDRIKADIQASTKTFETLNQKANPTDQDRIQLQEFNQRQRAMAMTLETWQQEFSQEIGRRQQDLRASEIAAAREALSAVGKKSGYTIIHEMQVAPYGANDLTGDTTKEMDSKTN